MTSYPAEIRSLTSLRYFAAAWVVFYHFAQFTGSATLITLPLVSSGYLGVDFFFILSGFVLTHVYYPQIEAGKFDYWMFVTKRFARVFPMHLLTLAAFLLIGVIAMKGWIKLEPWLAAVSFANSSPNEIIRGLVANLTLIHAWGATPRLLFNLPSWSISAEWFAYLMFPVFILLRRLPPHREANKLALVASVFVAMAFVYQIALHGELTRLTWNLGILRIFPEFLIGISLHRFGERWSAGPSKAIMGLCAAICCVAGPLLCTAVFTKLAIPLATLSVIGLAGVVLFAADADRHGRLEFLGTPMLMLLGEISYSVYMVHLGIGILLFDVVMPQWRPVAVLPASATVLGGLLVSTIVSWLTYRWVETPGRRWIVKRTAALNFREKSSVA